MKKEEIQAKIREIKKIVDEFEEPYKTESFKILLKNELTIPSEFLKSGKNLDEKLNNKKEQSDTTRIDTSEEILTKIAQACEVSIEKIKDVIDFENNHFILLKKVQGKTLADKQVNASLCLLTAWAKGKDTPWINVTDLTKELKEIPLSIKHLGENLTRTEFFVPKGTKRGAKYHITTKGWQEGIILIKKLIGEN